MKEKTIKISSIYLFVLSFVVYGMYMLYSSELVHTTETNYKYAFMALVLSFIPLSYLMFSKTKFFDRFSTEGLLVVGFFLIISTILLFSYTTIAANEIWQIFHSDNNPNNNEIFNKTSMLQYNLDKINLTCFFIISFLSFLILTYFNLRSMPNLQKKEVILRTFLLFFLQGIFSFFTLILIYVRF